MVSCSPCNFIRPKQTNGEVTFKKTT